MKSDNRYLEMKNAVRHWFLMGAIVLSFSGLTACDSSLLDSNPLDQPSDQTFFSNREELLLGVNAVYRDLINDDGWANLEWELDQMTDLAWNRGNWDGIQTVAAGAHDSQTGVFSKVWNSYYTSIGRANNLLENMHRAQDVVPVELYERIEGEARFLRAYFYHRLAELYGDVPLVTKPLTLEDAYVSRDPKATVVDFVLSELEAAAGKLPVSYSSADYGRATKGAALALKARVALYNEQWDMAIDAAERVMELGVYQLHPDYGELFTYAGEGSSEAILVHQYLSGERTHQFPQHGFTRMMSGWSTPVPTQMLVDSYLMIDGQRIDESPLYDPAHPFENRDPRLDASIVRPGMRFGNYRFETHPDSVQTWDYVSGTWVENKDVTNPYATFTGYVWKKYLDPLDATQITQSEIDWMLIRYAEVLLTYAEAKIEAGQIDGTVYDAINQIRNRAGMPEVAQGKSQEELRQIVRHERKIELALEGFRLFDLRRWKIAEYALNGPTVGRPKGSYNTQGIPVFDEHGIPRYDAYVGNMRVIEQRRFNPARDYLWPIPQAELDVNDQLEQNPGY